MSAVEHLLLPPPGADAVPPFDARLARAGWDSGRDGASSGLTHPRTASRS